MQILYYYVLLFIISLGLSLNGGRKIKGKKTSTKESDSLDHVINSLFNATNEERSIYLQKLNSKEQDLAMLSLLRQHHELALNKGN